MQPIAERHLHGELTNAAAVGAVDAFTFKPGTQLHRRRWTVRVNGSEYVWTAGMVEVFCLGVRAATRAKEENDG